MTEGAVQPVVASAPDLGPLLENAVPVHFVGGLVCGLTPMSRMPGDVLVRSELIRDRWHVYRRTGMAKGPAEVVMHREIRDEGRGAR